MLNGSRRTDAIARPGPETVVVPLPDEIDVTNSGQVHDALTQALCGAAAVVVADATGTTFCDCAGVTALRSAYHQAADSAQVRVAASPAVRRVLVLTGTSHLFDIYSSVRAALDAGLSPPRPVDPADGIVARHRWLMDLAESLQAADTERCTRRTDGMVASRWDQLAGEIEIDLKAEEETCYLPMYGSGPAALTQMQEAIADNDDIREAVADARLRRVGSAAWRRAVGDALRAYFEHVARMDAVVTDYRRRADPSQQEQLCRHWRAFIKAGQ